MKKLQKISLSQALKIHDVELKRFGGIQGIRDISLLTSALGQVDLYLFGKEIYSAPHEIAGVYAFHIIKNHPFLDGNKRTGIAIALIFLRINNYYLKATITELYDFTMQIASSNISKEDVLIFFKQRILPLTINS